MDLYLDALYTITIGLKEHGYTQQDLADRLGVSECAISLWLNNRRKMPFHFLVTALRFVGHDLRLV